MNYILVDRKPVPEPDIIKWAQWYETADRQVARTEEGGVMISTVFLGIDHGWRESGPPILYETMVFGGSHNEEMDRYATWEEAERGHWEMVNRVFSI